MALPLVPELPGSGVGEPLGARTAARLVLQKGQTCACSSIGSAQYGQGRMEDPPFRQLLWSETAREAHTLDENPDYVQGTAWRSPRGGLLSNSYAGATINSCLTMT